jgi:hypothetical protein
MDMAGWEITRHCYALAIPCSGPTRAILISRPNEQRRSESPESTEPDTVLPSERRTSSNTILGIQADKLASRRWKSPNTPDTTAHLAERLVKCLGRIRGDTDNTERCQANCRRYLEVQALSKSLRRRSIHLRNSFCCYRSIDHSTIEGSRRCLEREFW